jgi:hypothetical protein
MAIGKVQIKAIDVLIFILSIAAIVAVGISAYGQPRQNPSAVVTSPKGEWIFPLSTEQILTPSGLQGGCVVSFEDGSVRVIQSDCPEQICVRAGRVSRPGQWIACVPHRVFIEIQGRDEDPVDAINF